MPSKYLYETAIGYLLALEQLDKADGHDRNDINDPLSPAMYLLLGFFLELMLKAFLAKNGFDDGQLKDIGHDLTAAMKAASATGFKTELEIAETVAKMSPPHKALAFRYMGEGEVEVELIGPLLPIMRQWANEMYDLLGFAK